VQQLRRFVQRVVLVFDADAGGETGVDRALEIFVSQDVELAIATLPQGLDPFDLLVQQGPEPFQAALENAVEALDFKLNQVMAVEAALGVEGRGRAVDAVLGVVARAPEMPGQAGAIRQQLIITRIAQRLAIKDATLWARLKELREQGRARERKSPTDTGEGAEELLAQSARAPALEIQLMQVLLAEPGLVAAAAVEVPPEHIQHPGLRRLLEGLYALQADGEVPSLDLLRTRLDNHRLLAKALDLQEVGSMTADRADWLRQILVEFHRKFQEEPKQQEIKNQLHAAGNHQTALDLLRRLQSPN
jgi:DNA primase